MDRRDMAPEALSSPALSAQAAGRVATFLRAVYGWMAGGLAITAATAGVVAGAPALVQTIATDRAAFWGLLIAQFGIVIFLSARVDRLAPNTAALLYLLYSALLGVFLSFILLVYARESVAATFMVTAGTFGALAVYGTVTKRDLTGLGQFAIMGLFGVVLASIVGIFWKNDMFQLILSVCGVITFTALTAWDAKRLKAMALASSTGGAGRTRCSARGRCTWI